MQSKTLSSEQTTHKTFNRQFNVGLLRRNLTGYWPLWAVYAAVWMIALPVAQFSLLFGNSAKYHTLEMLRESSVSLVLGMGGMGGLWCGCIAGCLFAMALFSYLYSPRSVGMMHSFPIRRGQLFATNYLTGVLVFLSVQTLAFLLTAAVQAAAGVLSWSSLLLAFGCAAGQMLFFFSFACFCAMFTGQVLALPAFYIILNGLAEGLNQLIQNLASSFLYGYSGDYTPAWVEWLTPLWKLYRGMQMDNDWDDVRCVSYNYHLQDPACLWAYAAAGVVFAVLALLAYRRRRSETTGDIITMNWVKPVFCYGVGVCCALSVGQGLYLLVWQQFRMEATVSLLGVSLCMILAGLIGFFAAKMLLMKSFRVFRESWKGAAALIAVLLAFCVCMELDVTGVERRVPDADAVESVDFGIGGENYCSGITEDPALIARFCAAHQTLIDSKELEQQREEEVNQNDETDYGYGYVYLTYTLKDGTEFSRDYDLYYNSEDLKDAQSATAQYAALACDPGVQRSNLLGRSETERITTGEFQYYTSDNYSEYASFDGETAQTLYTALCQDIDAGHFGRNQFDAATWNKETYANCLTLYYSDGNDEMNSCDVTFSTNCTYLIAALEETGVIDDAHRLITYEQLNADDTNGGTYYDGKYYEDRYYEKAMPVEAEAVEDTAAAVAIIGGADGPTSVFVS
jgi:ABC-2 type transport system permease protein